MLYDIYFHNDFDGRAAAAIMLSFLRGRGDDIEHFTPIDYDLLKDWLGDDFFMSHKLFKGRRNPAIVVDFAFHPKAAWWFDHHETTFRKAAWKKKFKPNKQWHYDPEYKSCCGQVAEILRRDFGWKPPAHFKELVVWGDLMDSASYKSPQQAMDLSIPAIAIAAFFDRCGYLPVGKKPSVEFLAEQSLDEIAKRPDVRRAVREAEKDAARATAYVKKHIERTGRTAYIYFSKWQFAKPRYIPYALDARLWYLVRIFKKNGFYHLSVGMNPWRKKENKIDIGALIGMYGGGGHFNVGGAEIASRSSAERSAREIVAYLEKHHNRK
jgi:hypothetical protein